MRIKIERGVEVDMLFTPRLYSFKGAQGVTFECDGTQAAVLAMYADIMFCAALNHWTLTHREDEVCPYTRMQFHEWSAVNPKEYAKVILFAMQLLSGKTARQIAEETRKEQETAEEPKEPEAVKKKSCGLITRLSRIFSSETAD